MIKTRILGFLLALLPFSASCLENGGLTTQLALADSSSMLQLAVADSLQNDPVAGSPNLSVTTRTRIPPHEEFPHLDIAAEPDWDGLRHDSALFIGYQAAVVGVLFLMPESVSKWGEDQKKGNVFRKWNDNVNNLRKDKDEWEINYIGHPYFGSAYYVRARHRGYNREDSFWYAVIMSTIYEYGIEAIFEPVSIQDLIFTPVGGAIMGEYFMTARENIKRRIAETGQITAGDKFKLFMTDPLGSVNRKVDQWLGMDGDKQASLELFPMIKAKGDDNHTPELVGLQALYIW